MPWKLALYTNNSTITQHSMTCLFNYLVSLFDRSDGKACWLVMSGGFLGWREGCFLTEEACCCCCCLLRSDGGTYLPIDTLGTSWRLSASAVVVVVVVTGASAKTNRALLNHFQNLVQWTYLLYIVDRKGTNSLQEILLLSFPTNLTFQIA